MRQKMPFCVPLTNQTGEIVPVQNIPFAPSVDWDMVLLEQLTYVRTAHGGVQYQTLITGHQHAEEIAASWVRRLGYRDARATAAGPDDGIDVASLGAVAQVKYWANKKVPLKEVQRLAGTAARGQVPIFFARYGYTGPALRWADNPDNRVRLFILQPDGNIVACNYLARRTIWDAPDHVPADHRRAVSYRFTLPASMVLVCSRCTSATSPYTSSSTAAVHGGLCSLSWQP